MRRDTDALLRELRRLAEAIHEAQAELLVEAGIRAIDHRVLGALAADGCTTTRDLALSLLCPTSTIETSLSHLRCRRWVDEPATGPGPQPTHTLTERGRRALRDLQRAERIGDGLFAGNLETEELRRATRLLRAARRRLARRQRRRAPRLSAGLEPLRWAG